MPKSHPFSRWPDNLPPLETAEKLRAERDELLAALEAANELEWTEDPPQPLRARVSALIARIKGGG